MATPRGSRGRRRRVPPVFTTTLALLVVACVQVSTSPTPTAEPPTSAPTIAPQTLPPPTAPTAGPTEQPTPTPEPTATVAPTHAPTPTQSTIWTVPELALTGSFDDLAVVLDADGYAHVAAAGSGRDSKGIWYLTNATGAWTSERVSTPPVVADYEGEEYDGEPSISVDGDGSAWIAFTRWACGGCAPNPSDGIFYVSNVFVGWSEPVQLAGEETNSPSLIVQNGVIQLAYAEGMVPGRRSYPVWHGTDAGGSWQLGRVARNGGSPSLYMGSDGRPSILFEDRGVNLAGLNADGRFDVETLPGSRDGFMAMAGVNPLNVAVVAAWDAFSADSEHLNVIYAQGQDGVWSDPSTAIVDGDLAGVGFAGTGVVHIIAASAAIDAGDELLYASNATGEFVTAVLAQSGGRASAIAVDALGRPYVVYAAQDPRSERGIWLLVGPGS